MRCRRVRSFLSAYSNEELTGRRQLAIREHLSTCSLCRSEEALYRSIGSAGKQLAGLSVKDDFNTRVLNRIAQERFNQTRTRAWLPRRVPLVRWPRVVPVVSAVVVLALVAAYWLSPGAAFKPQEAALSGDTEADLYLTIQPADNPNLTAPLHRNWSLDQQLQWSDRMARISNSITDRNGFGDFHLTSGMVPEGFNPGDRVPYVSMYYKVQPIIRVYQSPAQAEPREGEEVF